MEFYIFLGIVAVVVIYAIVIYNNLVQYKNRGENAFSQIDVQLKRRYDLIPNLVETAKGYLSHERETLEAVIAARNDAAGTLGKLAGNLTDTSSMQSLAAAETALGGALGRMQIAVEAYPDLKASANMTQLSEELTSTENKVAFSRQAYNDAVTAYNTYRQSFPPLIFASIFGHKQDLNMLEFADREKLEEAPKVAF
ncbi:LemA family protein [Candidatus Persebacteraceae bacterium Df01]|jgi:LemA protein|uniref:LemA family protein n=1 Tax=Candidatus Doriopsillibacter californiensis TaxID=2970740 RepID=A0ABT7QK10_9GAMM|nr:LemA family protein [Candidatus Persebacteraceae bacterium Df01]